MIEERTLKQGTAHESDDCVLSIITPAYNEAENLSLLYQRICDVTASLNIAWEWLVVDDHSKDGTFAVISELASKDTRIQGIRFARNFGSHIALTCGLHHARGKCAVVMAADLQDPPETLPILLDKWQQGAQVVWAVRGQREGERTTRIAFARLYYFLMIRLVGMEEMPATGADFFLLDRQVIDALRQFNEHNVSMLALITWMGYRQDSISYTKKARLHGRSGWTLRKKLKLVVDSVTAFTYVPIRVISYLGFIVAVLGLLYALVVTRIALSGAKVEGWASLMVVVLFIGGIQMVMLGVLGEYLWRALDEARRRPRYLIESRTQHAASAPASGTADHRFHRDHG